jgi:hypothetical protein
MLTLTKDHDLSRSFILDKVYLSNLKLASHILKKSNHKTNLIPIVEDILSVDPGMRFAAIIDLKGNISEAIMKEGKTSLKSQKEEEHFCKQVALRRKIRNEFNKSLGQVNYVHIEREKVTQIVVYPKRKTVYVTMEPDVDMIRKLEIVKLIKEKTAKL